MGNKTGGVEDGQMVLVEGKLMHKTRMNIRRDWESRWCILCKDIVARADGRDAILKFYNQHPDTPKAKMKGTISMKTDDTEIQIIADSEIVDLSANNEIPEYFDVVQKKQSKSDAPFSFNIRAGDREFVFSANNKASFSRWIICLHVAVSWCKPKQIVNSCKYPMEVATLFQGSPKARKFASFLIENHCGSFRVQKIPEEVFREVVSRCMSYEDPLLADTILKCLKKMVPPSTLGWNGVLNAVKHEVDSRLSAVIESVCRDLPEVDERTGVLLAEIIETQKKMNLTTAEKEYLRAVTTRFAGFGRSDFSVLSPNDNLNEEYSQAIPDEWSELNMSLLRDIFNTHKVFEFGSFNCKEYKLEEFETSVKRAELKHFGNEPPCSQLLTNAIFESRATLFPVWLIHDDLFQVFQYFFGVCDGVIRLLNGKHYRHGLDVFCCIMPRKVVSLYDHNVIYQNACDEIDNWIKSKIPDRLCHHSQSENNQKEVNVEEEIQSAHQLTDDTMNVLLILIDRRDVAGKRRQTISIFGCSAFSEMSELTSNHFIGMRFTLYNDGDEKAAATIRSWLHYGNRQKLRFWPEQLIWFIPRLFVKPEMSGNTFVKKLFSDDYKHGFGVELNDPVFDKYYKMLTGWTHQSVNYRRAQCVNEVIIQYGLREYIRRKMLEMDQTSLLMHKLDVFLDKNAYCSDALSEDIEDIEDICSDDAQSKSNIMKELDGANKEFNQITTFAKEFKNKDHGKCTIVRVQELWNCRFARNLIDNLVRFEQRHFVINEIDLDEFDHSAIVRALDHLVEVHNMFSIRTKKQVQNYFMNQMRCELGGDCVALRHHCSRRRETDDDETEEKAQKESEQDIMVSVTRGVLSSAHCYLLHSEETLYRLSGQRNKFELLPFSTPVQEEEKKEDEEKDAPLSIDFGEHILQWLPYGHYPDYGSFEEEMIRNPASTLSPELWEEFRILCIALIDGRKWTLDHLGEVMCLKLYSDCTKLQNLFRKAHWKSTTLEVRKQFYQWGLLMYKTFLYHARPLPTVPGGTTPTPLYHGLNKLFRVQNTAPTYQGPFSTTISSHVANTFANGQGLVFNIKGSYTNPMRLIIGINMVRISCFKHEKEILLYSQTLPIKDTKTFETRDKTLVDHLIFSLMSTRNQVTDSKAFFRQIGIRFKPQWWGSIVIHPKLFKQTEFKKETVLDRLINLGIEDLTGERWSDWEPICEVFPKDESGSVHCDGSRINLSGSLQSKVAQQFIFRVDLDGTPLGTEYPFGGNEFFEVPEAIPVSPMKKHVVDLLVKPNKGTKLFSRISHELNSVVFAKYHIEPQIPVRIDWPLNVPKFQRALGSGGTIDIHSDSEISIAGGGSINANAVGLKGKEACAFYDEHVQLRNNSLKKENKLLLTFGTIIESQQHTKKKTGSAGGGIIALISDSDIVNDGIINTNGTVDTVYGGGSIALCAGGAVINRGQIECTPNGRITIQCRQFMNEGVLSPEPEVLITDGMMRREFEMVLMPWSRSGGKLQKIPLSIYRHRGHLTDIYNDNKEKLQYFDQDRYHPRNLLDKNGTETKYMGRGPAVGDWITFKIESSVIIIPKAVIIRNRKHPYDSGVKSISLSLSVDGEEFKHFAVIPRIEKDNTRRQYFDLKNKLSRAAIWRDNYKFMRLKVTSNWGGHRNRFYSFSAFGIECDPK